MEYFNVLKRSRTNLAQLMQNVPKPVVCHTPGFPHLQVALERRY